MSNTFAISTLIVFVLKKIQIKGLPFESSWKETVTSYREKNTVSNFTNTSFLFENFTFGKTRKYLRKTSNTVIEELTLVFFILLLKLLHFKSLTCIFIV